MPDCLLRLSHTFRNGIIKYEHCHIFKEVITDDLPIRLPSHTLPPPCFLSSFSDLGKHWKIQDGGPNFLFTQGAKSKVAKINIARRRDCSLVAYLTAVVRGSNPARLQPAAYFVCPRVGCYLGRHSTEGGQSYKKYANKILKTFTEMKTKFNEIYCKFW
jgi:hypothetical protein